MNWVIYHIASGHAFFSGVALVILAALTSTQSTPTATRVTVWGFLIGAIATRDSTLDTIHLSQAGHQRMAACVWEVVKSAFPEKETAEPDDAREWPIASDSNG